MLNTGEILDGKYQIERELCTGGMSKLYVARHMGLEHLVVIKEPHPNSESEDYLKKEAKVLAKLDHPNLARVIDLIADKYLVMNFVEGKNLEDVVKEQGKQPQESVISCSLQIVDVLNYLHNLEPPVMHRDIKPSNCILNKYSRVILVDFGIAKEIISATTQTKIGTEGYVAPEVYEGRRDTKSDIYSLGATMLALLLADNPLFPEMKIKKLKNKVGISKELIKVVERTLSFESAQRYTASEMFDVLNELKHGNGPTNSPSSIIEDNITAEAPYEIQGKTNKPDRFLKYIDYLIAGLNQPAEKLKFDRELITQFIDKRNLVEQFERDFPRFANLFIDYAERISTYLEKIKKNYPEKNFLMYELDGFFKGIRHITYDARYDEIKHYISSPPTILNLRANCLAELNECGAALRQYVEAICRQPDDPNIYADLYEHIDLKDPNQYSGYSEFIHELEKIKNPTRDAQVLIERIRVECERMQSAHKKISVRNVWFFLNTKVF